MLPPNVQLAPGSTDTANVKKLQDYLVSQGLMTEAQKSTGYGNYGPATTAAVQALQQRLGINATSTGMGVYGPQTSQMAVIWAQGPVNVNPPAGSTPTNVQPTTPPPTQQTQQQTQVSYNPSQSWNLSGWNSSGNQFTTKPVLTINGVQKTFNTPQEYISALQQIKANGGDTNGNIDRFISEFNAVVPNFTTPTPAPTPAPQQQTPAPTPTPTQQTPVTVTSVPFTNTPSNSSAPNPSQTAAAPNQPFLTIPNNYGEAAGLRLYPDGSIYTQAGVLRSGANPSWASTYTQKQSDNSWGGTSQTVSNSPTNMGTINVNGNQVVSTTPANASVPTNTPTTTPTTPVTTPTTTPPTTPTPTPTPTTPAPEPKVIPEGAYNLGNGDYLTKEEFEALDKKYYDEQTPFYEAQRKFDVSNYDTNEQSLLSNYDLTKRDYEARAMEDFDALNDNEGQKGTWASSERIKRRTNLQDKYNRSYESLYNTNYDNLYKNRLERAYNYGDSDVGANTPLQKYTNTFGDTNITTSTNGSGATYNPFGFQGKKNVERKNNSRLAAIDQLNTFTYKNQFTQ